MKKIHLSPVIGLGLLFFVFTSCQSIDKPKSTLEGQTSFRFMDSGRGNDKRFSPPSNERDQLIQAAIQEVFESNGVEYAPMDAELIIGYLVIRMDNVSTTVIPTYYGPDQDKIRSLAHKKGVLDNRNPVNFEVGAIVVDVIDTKKQELIYRGSAKRDIMGLEEISEMQPLIESAVAEALEDFFK